MPKFSALLPPFLVAFFLVGFSGTTPPGMITLDNEFIADAEIDRLRFFREIDASVTLKEKALTGRDVRVTIMGEMVDANHPDLQSRVVKQYNLFSKKGHVLTGNGNMPFGAEHLGSKDGHGTHIAGTIAAACDELGIQGLACESTLDVYNLGAYDDVERFGVEGWGDTHEFERFLVAFTNALDDVSTRNASQITTGSFNLESPAISYDTASPLNGLSLTNLIDRLDTLDNVDELFASSVVTVENPDDESALKRFVSTYDDDAIALMSLAPLTLTWQHMADAVGRYQATDGVYLVTESNYKFGNYSSTLNALPSLSASVDEDLWLSVVMAVPEGFDTLDENSTRAEVDALMEGHYTTPINSCGELAQTYCILTPSYQVMSTMTEQVAFWDSPLYSIDERLHQVLDGHSMGAPMVAATLALMQQYNTEQSMGYSMKDLVRILKANASRDFPGYNPVQHGVGLLNVDAAITAM